MSNPVMLNLRNPDIILMSRPESPALVHGEIPRDADPRLDPLWDHGELPKGTARVERGPDGDVVIANITEPIAIEVHVVLGLPPEKAAGMERRPSAMVMMYPDEKARIAGLRDFRTGGARAEWLTLGIVLPNATTDSLRT